MRVGGNAVGGSWLPRGILLDLGGSIFSHRRALSAMFQEAKNGHADDQ